MNHNCDTNNIIFVEVHSLMAKNLEHAFLNSQNDFNSDYRKKGVRSTSVGDIIRDDNDFTEKNLYMILGVGYNVVSEDVTFKLKEECVF